MTEKEIDRLHKCASTIRCRLTKDIFELHNIDNEVKDFIEEIILNELNRTIENK